MEWIIPEDSPYETSIAEEMGYANVKSFRKARKEGLVKGLFEHKNVPAILGSLNKTLYTLFGDVRLIEEGDDTIVTKPAVTRLSGLTFY